MVLLVSMMKRRRKQDEIRERRKTKRTPARKR